MNFNVCSPNSNHTSQGLIQDFLLGGETIFLKKFWIFSDSRTDKFSFIILVIVYSSAIDQFKCSHFVYLPVYHIH